MAGFHPQSRTVAGWLQLQLGDTIYATLCSEHDVLCHEGANLDER